MSTNIAQLLRRHPFCADLDDAQLGQLAAIAHVETYADGDFVFRENAPADELHLIVEGVVRLELHAPGGVRTIQTLDTDDAVGLSWLAPGGRWMFDAIAEEPATLVALDGAKLMALCDADPLLGFRVTRRLLLTTTARLQATRMRLMDVYR